MRYYILLLLGIVVMSFGFAVMPRAQSVQRETPTAATETLSENQTSADKDANSKKGFDPYNTILSFLRIGNMLQFRTLADMSVTRAM